MPPDTTFSSSALRPSRRIHAASQLDSSYLAYAKSIAHGNSDPQLRLDVCRQFVRCGMIGETVAMLATLMDVRDLRASVVEVMADLRELRRHRAEDRKYLPDRETEDEGSEDRGYWVVPANSDTTLVAFTGRAKRLGLSVYFMQSLLGRLNVNVIYLFDWSHSYYFGGVSGLGADVETTVRQLRGLCADLQSRRVLCLGQSAGGFGALHYGLKLGAEGIMAFSPIIIPVLAGKTRDRIGTKIGRPLTEDETNLRQRIASTDRAPHIEIVYGAENVADTASARYLSGLHEVAEHPLPGVSSHGTIQETVASNTFGTLMDGFIRSSGRWGWDAGDQSAINDSQ
ncbi:hypothetical protein [Ancylobacter sp. FA202]|uniref:hypothetical protein n=1 Tax=Ancylobacter sp. FA202 TaxID=1111106 RepID=UPI00036DD348|nr:hypothetical protein [Ancylobacter sp. FA202]